MSALFVDYGQAAARRERAAIRRIARHYGISHQILKCRQVGRKFGGGLILGRNGFLIFAALMHFPRDRGLISIGAHAGTDYYDCSVKFFRAMRELVRAYTQGTIDVSAPFLRFSKRDVLSFARTQQVPLTKTYSCELGRPQPCGRCASCRTLVELNIHARS